MLNSYRLQGGDNNNNQTVIMNQPSHGMIQKSNPLSRFINVKKDSDVFSKLFPSSFEDAPVIEIKKRAMEKNYYPHEHYESVEKTYKKEVIVLQCMVYGQDEFFVEYVFVEDLNQSEK